MPSYPTVLNKIWAMPVLGKNKEWLYVGYMYGLCILFPWFADRDRYWQTWLTLNTNFTRIYLLALLNQQMSDFLA